MNDNSKVAKINLRTLREVLCRGDSEYTDKVSQNFRLEAFNYTKLLEISIDQHNLNEVIGIANKFATSAKMLGGNELAKRCLELAKKVSENGSGVSRKDLIDIANEKSRLFKAIDEEASRLDTSRS